MVPVWQESGKKNSKLVLRLENFEHKIYEKVEKFIK